MSFAALCAIFIMFMFLNIGSEFTAERMLYDATTIHETVPLKPTLK